MRKRQKAMTSSALMYSPSNKYMRFPLKKGLKHPFYTTGRVDANYDSNLMVIVTEVGSYIQSYSCTRGKLIYESKGGYSSSHYGVLIADFSLRYCF